MRNCLVETRWCYCNRVRVSCILSSQLFTPATSSSIGLQCLMLWWSLKWSFVVSDYLPVIILSFSFPFFLVSKSKNSWIVMISTTIMVCGDQVQMSTNRRLYCDFNFRLSIEGSCFVLTGNLRVCVCQMEYEPGWECRVWALYRSWGHWTGS